MNKYYVLMIFFLKNTGAYEELTIPLMIKDLDKKEIKKILDTIPHSTPETIIGTQTITKYFINDCEPELIKTLLEVNSYNTPKTIIRTIIKKQYQYTTSNEKRVKGETIEYDINYKALN